MQEDFTNVDYRMCNRCKESFPLTLEYFGVNRALKSGFANICRSCAVAKYNEYKKRNRDKVLAAKRAYQEDYNERNPYQYRKWREANKDIIGTKGVQKQREWRKHNPEKNRAQKVLQRAVNKGEVARPELCSVCEQSGRIEAHHVDYTKPLDVIWLCVTCHRRIHSNYL